MAISFKRYVDITSGVGGGAGVRLRDFILRIFTTNDRVPPATVVEMDNATDVATYFGITSEEYKRAVAYFGFISKLIVAPKKISFGRWVNALTVGKIYGRTGSYLLATFTPVTTGSFKLTLGGFTSDVLAMNFGAAGSLAAVATVIQTAVRAIVAGGTAWTGATVTFDAPSGSFLLVGGAGSGAVNVQAAATGVPIAALLGWTQPGAIFSAGAAAEEPVAAFINSVEASDNFGTFVFATSVATPSQAQALAVATQNDSYNVRFLYSIAGSLANSAAYYAVLAGQSGVAYTIDPVLPGEYPEQLPASIMAATDYTKRNSVQNYMFQQAALTPSVVNNADANSADSVRANYYGQTQTAGQSIAFYQRGVMMGLSTDPVDMNVYANEMWFKDAAGAAIMSLLLSAARVSANAAGRAQLLAVIQSVVEQAAFNGTISIGKAFTITQKLFIQNATGDALAWMQVYRLGYWLDLVMQPYVTTDGRTEYKAVYTLIYSKDDTVRKVEGTHVLI